MTTPFRTSIGTRRPTFGVTPVGAAPKPSIAEQLAQRPRIGVQTSPSPGITSGGIAPGGIGPTGVGAGPPPGASTGAALGPEIGGGGPQGQPPSMWEAFKPLYQRPLGFLQLVLRVLSVPESIVSGFAYAFNKEGVGTSENPALASWAILKAMGKGFKEIPTNTVDALTGQPKTFAEFTRDTNDPNSFWYRHATPIGLGMAFLYDPVMYISFGATSASKIIAKNTLALEAKRSSEEALKYMASGTEFIGKDGSRRVFSLTDNYDDVRGYIHAAMDRPWTLEDAMDIQRAADKGLLLTDEEVEILKEAGVDVKQTSLYRRVFPRGGQGIRFIGKEIPGTREMNQALGAGIRSIGRKGTAAGVGSHTAITSLIPDAKLGSAFGDLERATGLVAFRDIRQWVDEASRAMTEDAKRIALIENPTARVVGSIMGKPTGYVSIAERRGLLRQTSKAGMTDEQAHLYDLANLRKGDVVKLAKKIGVSESDLKQLEQSWSYMVDKIDDPVEVVARYLHQEMTKLLRIKAIDHVIDNRILARPIIESAKNAKAIMKGEFMEMPGVMVKDVETYSAMIGQNAKPFRWKGKDYAVSDAVYETLEEIRNPAFIDKELGVIFNAMNGAQNLWKIPATVMNPAFHVMNSLGGMWNNGYAGPYGPIDYLGSLARVLSDQADEAGRRSAAAYAARAAYRVATFGQRDISKIQVGGKTLTGKEARQYFMREHQKRGAGGGLGYVGHEVPELAKKVVGQRPLLPRRPTGFRPRNIEMGRAFTYARRGYVGYVGAQVGADIAAAEGWIDDINLPGANELAGIVLASPEIARFGRKVSNTVEQTLRTVPAQEALYDMGLQATLKRGAPLTPAQRNVVVRMAKQRQEATGPIFVPAFENLDRGLTKAEQKVMYDIGNDLALHFQFDYGRLSTFERRIAKTIFPFWTFYKNNLALQIAETAKRPRFLQGFYRMATEGVDALEQYIGEEYGASNYIPPEMEKFLPEYFDQLGAFQVPVPDFMRERLGLPLDTPLFLNPKLPFVSLNLVPPVWEALNNQSVTPLYQRLAYVASPVAGSWGPLSGLPVPGARLMLETVTGLNLGLARPIDYQRAGSQDWRESYTDAPGYVKFLPGWLRDHMGIFRDEETGVYKMHSTLKYVMDTMSSPFIANYGKTVPTAYSGERSDKAKADLVSWLTGVRLMPVDFLKIRRSWAYRVQNMLQAQQQDLRARGKELDPQDAQVLSYLRTEIKQLKQEWDQRNVELYGTTG